MANHIYQKTNLKNPYRPDQDFYTTDFFTDVAIEYMEDNLAVKKKPFFLWVHFFDPHKPYQYRPDFEQPEIVEELANLAQHQEARVAYTSEIQFADHNMGKVLDVLETLGIAERTLTVFTADHGESLGEHGYLGHRQHVYENIIYFSGKHGFTLIT